MSASDPPAAQRVDKWLWHARFFKTRTLAAALVEKGRVRRTCAIGTQTVRLSRAADVVRVGDTLTFPMAGHIRVVRVLALADRRGPAAEARALYEDLDPPA
jgi:ribosome-associated heat shock protein Hsp15